MPLPKFVIGRADGVQVPVGKLPARCMPEASMVPPNSDMFTRNVTFTDCAVVLRAAKSSPVRIKIVLIFVSVMVT